MTAAQSVIALTIIGLAVIAFGLLLAYSLCKAAAMQMPQEVHEDNGEYEKAGADDV